MALKAFIVAKQSSEVRKFVTMVVPLAMEPMITAL